MLWLSQWMGRLVISLVETAIFLMICYQFLRRFYLRIFMYCTDSSFEKKVVKQMNNVLIF